MNIRLLSQLVFIAVITGAFVLPLRAQTAKDSAEVLLKKGDAEMAKGDVTAALKTWSEAAAILNGNASAEFEKRNGQPILTLKIEHPATPASGSVGPAYPTMLKMSGVEGGVLAEFVVNTDGNADLGSLKIIRSTHKLFTEAVRDALPNMRWNPAEIGGRKVRQRVQAPFSFTLTRE